VTASVHVARAPRLVRLVEWYQRAAEGRPSPCRFSPSCSSYARDALLVHGTRHGLWLTVRRLSRCRPLGPSGWDPVPERADACTEPHPHHHHADAAGDDLVTGLGLSEDR
jgi:putative membrane protein insertion efficiency factor